MFDWYIDTSLANIAKVSFSKGKTLEENCQRKPNQRQRFCTHVCAEVVWSIHKCVHQHIDICQILIRYTIAENSL